MNMHEYNIYIPAPTEAEGDTKVEALMTLASHLSGEELKAIAHVVTSDPDKVALAKEFLGIQ